MTAGLAGEGCEFYDAENKEHVLTAPEVKKMYLEVIKKTSTLKKAARMKKTEILKHTDEKAVTAYDIYKDWP